MSRTTGFVKPTTRTATLAKVHYNCLDDSKWKGYPMMGKAEFGRDSHHNSFILWEDVESYGAGGLITPMTLALFEDLGVYLADYTKSKVPNFGAYGGCKFVNTRCRYNDLQYNDRSYSAVHPDECQGWLNMWGSGGNADYLLKNDFRINKCNNDNYRNKCGKVAACHPECIIRTASNEKEFSKWRPLLNATGALPPIYPTLKNEEKENLYDSLYFYLVPILLSILFSLILGFIYNSCHSLFSSEEKMSCLSHFISLLFAAFGVGIIAASIYVIVMTDLYGHFLSISASAAFACFGLVICIFGVLQYKTAKTKSTFTIFTVGTISAAVLVGQLILVGYMIYFVSSFDSVDNAEVGTGDYERWEKHGAMSDNLKSMESYICKSYQKCCRDPNLLVDGSTSSKYDITDRADGADGSNVSIRSVNITVENQQSCVTLHPGMSEAEQELLKIKDPSQPGFCKMVSGSENKIITSMSDGACMKMDEIVIGFNQTDCQRNFCKAGIDGYNKFVETMISMARRNMYSFAMVCFVLGFVQLFQLILLLKLYNYHKTHSTDEGETELSTKNVKLVSKQEDLRNRYKPQ